MARPTLFQALLNRPSQSYSAEPAHRQRNLHSVKAEMLKAAAESNSNIHPHRVLRTAKGPRIVIVDVGSEESDDNDDDIFYTPSTSPRQSLNVDQILPVDPISTLDKFISTAPPLPSLNSSRYPSSSSTTTLSSLTTLSPSTISPASTSDTTPPTNASPHSQSDYVSYKDVPISAKRLGKRRAPLPTSVSAPEIHDWAKDVRWLVPPASSDLNLSSNRSAALRTTRKRDRETSAAIVESLLSQPISMHAPRRPKSSSGRSRTQRSATMSAERMSALWEEDEGEEGSTGSDVHPGIDTDSSKYRSPPIRSRSISTPSSPSTVSRSYRSGTSHTSSASGGTSSQYSTASRVVDIPVPLPVSDGGTPKGFTSLVLPRAAPSINLSSKRNSLSFFASSSSVDITRSGLAQTTMSTVSLTKDASVASFGGTLSRKFSLSSNKSSSSDLTPAHLRASLPLPLGLTSTASPPSKVGSSHVLVQVHAVGLDELDDVIVKGKVLKTDSFGFIPGRSFVGRVIETGYEVTTVVKSDWVIGLLDARKCGALSEFIVVDKRRLARCPSPSLPGLQRLTLEQLALLPLCGIPAHRAVRTCAFLFPRTNVARVLVLQAHAGAGALILQELASQGLAVTAQISLEEGGTDASSSTDATSDAGDIRSSDVVNRVKQWGATKVIVDDPLAAIESCKDSEFDVVVDTVGGRRIWDASRRVLNSAGQFTTIVGDSDQALPSLNSLFKTNMRSLRRTFVKKDHKAIGYAWVSPVADLDGDGEDVRDSLVAVIKLAESFIIHPLVNPEEHFSFERAPMIFSSSSQGSILSEGRTAIVKIF